MKKLILNSYSNKKTFKFIKNKTKKGASIF